VRRLLFLLLALAGPVCAQSWETSTGPWADRSWSATDKTLLATYLAGAATDYCQTRSALSDGRKDVFPFVTDNTSLTVSMVTVITGVVGVAHFVPKWRRRVLVGANVVQWSIVANNACVGISIGW
jgi:hypothetical protein